MEIATCVGRCQQGLSLLSDFRPIAPHFSPSPTRMADICEHCVDGHVLPGKPKGFLEDSLPLPAYYSLVSGQENGPKSTNAIVMLPDILGLTVPNPKIIADMYCEKTGMDVWIADIFKGLHHF